MIAQLESEKLSAEEMGQRICDFSREALAVLQQKRERDYAAACAALDEELAALAVESDALQAESESSAELLACAERVKRFEYDQLIVQGETAQAGAKLTELEELEAAAKKLTERRGEIAKRTGQIEVAKRTALRATAEDFKAACIALIRGAEVGLALTLDGTKDALDALETQLGASLYQPSDLTAPEQSAEWVLLHKFYRGRG